MSPAKPFDIAKRMVWESYQDVKRSGGGTGVDGQRMEDFEKDLKNNLYKIWNRMCSGSYFPSPVLRVEIPKTDGGVRALGIPTITDRIAQAVVKRHLEPLVEPHFHEDSYGYRPWTLSPWMLWPAHDSGAGEIAGCWTWTSSSSLTALTMA